MTLTTITKRSATLSPKLLITDWSQKVSVLCGGAFEQHCPDLSISTHKLRNTHLFLLYFIFLSLASASIMSKKGKYSFSAVGGTDLAD